MKVYHYTHRYCWAQMQKNEEERCTYDRKAIMRAYKRLARTVDSIKAMYNPKLQGLSVAKAKRTTVHPGMTLEKGEKVFQNAFWSFPSPLPEQWLEKKEANYGLKQLFRHCSRRDFSNLTLLEIDLDNSSDVWATDWSHVEECSDFKRYYNSMIKYESEDNIAHMKMPEIICFSNVPTERINEIALPDIPKCFRD